MKLAEGSTRRTFADLDKEAIDDINSRSLDEESSNLEIQVKAYDRDTGIGKCDLVEEDLRRVSFSVPVEIRTKLRRTITRAMNEDAVEAEVRLFRTKVVESHQ